MKDNWDFLPAEFRRLGGLADNICQKEGENGRGIFSVNPSLPSRIFTPSKLLINIDDIYLEDNKLRIKKDKEYDQEIRTFFNFYQDNFSWESGGKERTELFEKGLSLFNSNLKELIKRYALVDIDARHQGKWDNVIKTVFLNARAIKFGDYNVIAPVWELVNHKVRALPFSLTQKGISTPNYPALESELRFSYNNISPIERFFAYGFYSEETIIFSVPFELTFLPSKVKFCCKGKNLNDDSIKIEKSNTQITIDGLPIADINNPKLPYYYFDEVLRRINGIDIPKDILIQIFQLNISTRKEIIDESHLIDNLVSKTLIKVMNYEIDLIRSHN